MKDKLERLIASAPPDANGAIEVNVILANGAAFQGAAKLDGDLVEMLTVASDQQGRPVGMVEITISIEAVVAVMVKSSKELPAIVTPPAAGRIVTPRH